MAKTHGVMRCRALRGAWFAGAAWLMAWTAAACGQEVLAQLDFEQEGLAQRWTAVKELQAERVEFEPADLEGVPPGGPAGFGVEVATTGKAGFYTQPSQIPEDLSGAAAIEFWVHRTRDEAKVHPTTPLEVQFLEADGRTRFWRLFEINHEGWKKYSAPLKWFRTHEGRVPRWEKIARLGFWFRAPALVDLDGIVLLKGEAGAARLQAKDLQGVAFPKDNTARAHYDGALAVLTNAPDLKGEELLAHLKKVEAAVVRDVPGLPAPQSMVPLIVFGTREQYEAFPPRFAVAFNSSSPAPRSDGYTLLGVATSSWDSKQGTLRPVYAHEFVHARLTAAMGLQNRGEWLQEGFAVRYQMEFHPQKNLAAIIHEGISNPEKHLPLEDLCSGETIPLDRYWQAMTVVDLLVSQEPYRGKFAQLLEAFSTAGNTDLSPHIQPVLGTDWPALTAAWKTRCAAAYTR